MCQFFSLVSDGKGKPMYFDAKIRKKILNKELSYELDSHTSIADYYGYKAEKEDKLNKYEYNPLTKNFQIDQLNTTDDSKDIKKFCEELDFKLIVPELIIKPIIHPFKDRHIIKVTKKDIQLLKQWDSVWDSVRDSVGDSVGDSVWGYISTFFNIKYKYDFSSCAKLWEKGIIPSFDGKLWRLHGENGKIIFTISKEDLLKLNKEIK